MAKAQAAQESREVRAVQPRVRLVAYTKDPYQLAVASARTCYAADFEFVGRLTPKGERSRTNLLAALPDLESELAEIGRLDVPHDQRIIRIEALLPRLPTDDLRAALQEFANQARVRSEGNAALASSIYEAGHHTPFQHPTFVFALEDVSRNVVESFLHNHVFYNSEQQSQRYVEMRRADVHAPASVARDPQALAVFQDAVRQAWDAYHALRERLVVPNQKVMGAIGKIKGQTEKEALKEAEKKAQEMARYVVPVAAATQLYHTVSGIVLMRYWRMCEASSAPDEARAVVEAMVAEVRKVDPAFVQQVQETPRPRAEHAEWRLQGDAPVPPLPVGAMSVLVHSTPDAANVVRATVREVTGTAMADAQLLAAVMDPGRNPVWNDTLNTWDHSPVLRALRHVHLTYRKRLSLTAYAQDQRHRMTPGTRPQVHRLLGPRPDVHVPDIIAGDAECKRIYDAAIATLWSAMQRLQQMGVPREDAAYLLPNATHVTFHQSGDLLSFIHKWRLRLCFNAQKEIFDASLEELRQAQAAMPELTRWVGPPCTFVSAAVPKQLQGSVEACCPESSWCGVKVWANFDAAKGTPKRPY